MNKFCKRLHCECGPDLFDLQVTANTSECNKEVPHFFCMPNMEQIHIGKVIRKQLHNQGRSTVWLARQIPCSANHLYKVYRKPDINTGLLRRISEILEYNFFELYK